MMMFHRKTIAVLLLTLYHLILFGRLTISLSENYVILDQIKDDSTDLKKTPNNQVFLLFLLKTDLYISFEEKDQ